MLEPEKGFFPWFKLGGGTSMGILKDKPTLIEKNKLWKGGTSSCQAQNFTDIIPKFHHELIKEITPLYSE